MNSSLDIRGVRDQLRALLGLPARERSTDWEDEVGRAVGLLSVDYPAQADPTLALEELALIKLAAQRGNKAAKARVLTHARWRAGPPPPLSTGLQSTEERKAALQGLARVRAPWVLEYALAELASADKALKPNLLNWVLANVGSSEEVVRALSDERDLGQKFAEFASDLVAALLKSAGFGALPTGDSFLEAVSKLVATAQSLEGETSPQHAKKSRLRLQAALLDLLSLGTSKEPRFFLRPAFSGALVQVSALAAPLPRASALRRTSILESGAAVLALLYSMAEGDSRRDVAKVSQALAAEHEGYRRFLEAVAATNPGWMGLIREQDPSRGNRSGGSIEDALGSLLPEVDDLCRKYPDDPAIQQLRHRVETVAREANVREFGREGEEVSFDPLRHVLAGSSTAVPGLVAVRRSGVVAVRDDGSERVLVKAVVESK